MATTTSVREKKEAVSARAKKERSEASKNEDLIAEDADLAISHEDGKKDEERTKELAEDVKAVALHKVIAHDLTAENGPHDAQSHDPKPPYWELRQPGANPEDISHETVKEAIRLVEKNKEEEEKALAKK